MGFDRPEADEAEQIQVLEGLEAVRKRPECTSVAPMRGLMQLLRSHRQQYR